MLYRNPVISRDSDGFITTGLPAIFPKTPPRTRTLLPFDHNNTSIPQYSWPPTHLRNTLPPLTMRGYLPGSSPFASVEFQRKFPFLPLRSLSLRSQEDAPRRFLMIAWTARFVLLSWLGSHINVSVLTINSSSSESYATATIQST